MCLRLFEIDKLQKKIRRRNEKKLLYLGPHNKLAKSSTVRMSGANDDEKKAKRDLWRVPWMW